MLKISRRCALVQILFAALIWSACITLRSASAAPAHSTDSFTAWDDYYLYAGFQVNDAHVVSTNDTPTSQPQQDDDIEVFIDTLGPGGSKTRTPGTYQMAVSAASGAYFSVGDPSGKPKAKLVFTYKYATTVNGTLNRNNDTDIGYTVEMAIPWRELGLTSPPKPGTVWGFNVINRDRDSLDKPASRLASLSPDVQSAEDVQNPQKWTKIIFTDGVAAHHSGPDEVYCPRVVSHFPQIDGVIKSGEWDRADGFLIGAPTVVAAAPTEEPNITESPFEAIQQAMDATPAPTITDKNGKPITEPNAPSAPPAPAPAPAPVGPPVETATVPDYDIALPGGGMVHVGKMPAPVEAPQDATPPSTYPVPKHGKGKHNNTEEAQLPTTYGDQIPATGPKLDTGQGLGLPQRTRVSSLFFAIYHPEYTSASGFVNDPMTGAGSWFGAGSVQYQVDEMRDARRAGVDAMLVVYDPDNPSSVTGLASMVQALQLMKANQEDYPLLALRLVGSGSSDTYTGIKQFFEPGAAGVSRGGHVAGRSGRQGAIYCCCEGCERRGIAAGRVRQGFRWGGCRDYLSRRWTIGR